MSEPRWREGDLVMARQPIAGVVTKCWAEEDDHEYVEIEWLIPEAMLEADAVEEWKP